MSREGVDLEGSECEWTELGLTPTGKDQAAIEGNLLRGWVCREKRRERELTVGEQGGKGHRPRCVGES